MYSFVFLLCLCHTIMAITKVEHLRLNIREQVLLQTLQMKADVAELKNLIEDQNTKNAELKNFVEHQNTKIADQNTKIAELKNLVEHQNTKIAEEKIKFANQNTKMCKLEAQIEKLINHQTATTKTATSTTPTATSTTATTAATTPITTASSTSDTSSGVVFTRWGRRDCPAGISTPVYNGTVGGSNYDRPGAAVNYLCMPNDPTWNNNKLYKPSQKGYVYGGMYGTFPDSSLKNQPVVCVICRAPSFSTKVMIPGRDKCYPGWTKAYSGELTSGRHDAKAATEYACLDRQPQNGGYIWGRGVWFYPVLARCSGGLPCPPYQDRALLTCVVCLK